MGSGGDEFVILVHGTGASAPGPVGEERWWQTESAFGKELLIEVSKRAPGDSDRHFRLESFVWSGANSERERRIAGQILAERLKDLEGRGAPFHLVGHSHGGSVIWHAMRRLLRDGRPGSLRSWTTIGTPFLTFGDKGGFYLLLFVLLSLFAIGVTFLLLGALPAIYWPELGRVVRDAPLPALVGASLSGAVAIGAVGYSLLMVALQLWRRVRLRSRRLPPDDAAFLGERWFALAHPEDEPINALRASVIQPAEEFMPRLKAGLGARAAGTFERLPLDAPAGGKRARPALTPGGLASAAVSWVAAPFYNRLVAPLLDQFLWETVKQVAQGKDVPGEYMVDCDRAPPELRPYWKDASPDFSAALSILADSAAAGTARELRSRLAAVGQGTASVSALSGALSWKEVIHTAYFEPGCGVAAMVAGRIVAGGRVRSLTAQPDAVPSAEPRDRVRTVFRPRYMNLALAVAVAAMGAGATFSTVAVERAWLWPFTNAFQVDRIYRSLFDARSTSLRLMAGLDKVLIRWVLLDRTEEAIATALRLDDAIRYMGANARLERLQDIAFAIGAKGSTADLTLLLGSKVCAESGTTCLEGLSKEEVSAYLLAHAVVGARAAGNGAHQVPEKMLREIVSRARRDTWSPGYFTRMMLYAGAFDLAERFAEGDSSFCDGVREWARDSAGDVPTDTIPGKLRDCLDAPIADFVAERSYTLRNYFSLPATVLRRIVGGLPASQLKSCRSEILGAAQAMSGCEEDRTNLLPVSEGGRQDELRYDPAKSTQELLTDISNYGTRFSSDLPACFTKLDERISSLQLCMRYEPDRTAPDSAREAQMLSEIHRSWWKSHVWKVGTAPQPAICGEDGFGLGGGYGRKMQAINSQMAELTPNDRRDVARLLALRTDYEFRQKHFTDPARADSMEIPEARCGWASLALAWAWLGNDAQSTRLLDAVLPKVAPASGTQILDFYLGIAEALAKRAPAQSKRFLDRSFELVDDNDPALFFKTSDGSVDESFAYRKSDIARLYADIGEYRLAAATNDRVNQFSEGAVSAYVTILDSEIRSSRRYDEATLRAALVSPRPPGFRLN